uniref:Uncharacterized protein n=1 Tax=Chromera velia CCMP2878 TaxID=1169474 RepID=A0A0G4I4K3_9ALVE|eukprot:Cvel_10928.t1-p1 / transcript=Cvel_10928.t1 / gene=Cvel_10928 / organism=Chromera_velia_CCMP2878 / gene_product=hypothetical protein / transcript_product=hypothetical protein / location=Cvel_scaffold671:68066-70037(+) / protein_length=357 / sequence_SO=supercontig / SO=protein_coding / is_pseudo=false
MSHSLIFSLLFAISLFSPGASGAWLKEGGAHEEEPATFLQQRRSFTHSMGSRNPHHMFNAVSNKTEGFSTQPRTIDLRVNVIDRPQTNKGEVKLSHEGKVDEYGFSFFFTGNKDNYEAALGDTYTKFIDAKTYEDFADARTWMHGLFNAWIVLSDELCGKPLAVLDKKKADWTKLTDIQQYDMFHKKSADMVSISPMNKGDFIFFETLKVMHGALPVVDDDANRCPTKCRNSVEFRFVTVKERDLPDESDQQNDDEPEITPGDRNGGSKKSQQGVIEEESEQNTVPVVKPKTDVIEDETDDLTSEENTGVQKKQTELVNDTPTDPSVEFVQVNRLPRAHAHIVGKTQKKTLEAKEIA